jgi:FKBP-type peptidyl-prolyl cis-trans isomerase 2
MKDRILRCTLWVVPCLVIALALVAAGCTTQDNGANVWPIAENGDTVQVHYRGYLDSGEEFDSSYERGEPLSFVVGAGQMISGFDAAVVGMALGDTKTIHLTPEEAYGQPDETLIRPFPREDFGNESDPRPGDEYIFSSGGSQFQVVVVSVNETTVVIDANHPLAGENLNFDIELVGLEKNAEADN